MSDELLVEIDNKVDSEMKMTFYPILARRQFHHEDEVESGFMHSKAKFATEVTIKEDFLFPATHPKADATFVFTLRVETEDGQLMEIYKSLPVRRR